MSTAIIFISQTIMIPDIEFRIISQYTPKITVSMGVDKLSTLHSEFILNLILSTFLSYSYFVFFCISLVYTHVPSNSASGKQESEFR